VRMR
jgi:hypothetical protein